MSEASMSCVSFRAFSKNTLKGFCDFKLEPFGIVLRDCSWHEKDGREWVGFPAKKGPDKNGVADWIPIVVFAEGANRDRFQKAAVAAIMRQIQAPETAPR